jgi:transposase, IS5 family
MRVRTVYADPGFSTPAARAELHARGIHDIVMPARGGASPAEQQRAWRRRYRYRNGIEGRISQAKRHGLRRTRLRGLAGAQTWVAGITLAHNLRRLALLTS